MIQNLNQAEIWLANLNPGKGTEPGKTRPVLILQDQAMGIGFYQIASP